MSRRRRRSKLKVIPLGGLGEIGKNMLVLEHGDDIIAIDAGLMFPEEDMLGVDLVIPDISYLLDKSDRVRGIIITHGHEDHIGALPYILRQLNVPVYSTKLTNGLISVKLKEHKLLKDAKLNVVQPGDKISLGAFEVEPFQVSHSIPDAVGLAIHTPLGTVVHSGDFKIDHTPVDGRLTDFARLSQLGAQGVLLLFSDSTYVEEPGYNPSEKVVGEAIDRILAEAPGRVIIATFASLISRVQQVIDAAAKHNRQVFVVGKSMIDNVQMALELGYLNDPAGTLRNTGEMRALPNERTVIVATGSQGEPTSALARIANRDHRQIHIIPGDTVVISATVIPGNEGLVNRTIDNLFKQGAQVLYSKVADVHVHGHATQEELKMLLNLVRPRFFVPIHGEYRHLSLHAKLAQSLGIPENHTFVLENGDVLELDQQGARIATKISSSYVYVDGLGVGDIGQVVLRDRRALARDGILVVIIALDEQTGKVIGQPDIVSRGFVDMRESEALIETTRGLVIKVLDRGGDHSADWGYVNAKVKDALSKFLYEQTKRRPMILPVAVRV
ncbi:MAG: ribonuclease J [Chloroflexi bacterium RBG_13_54_9]|nr:MAG: ribonuclease J [Chloroflexi bacterium RBG_13_54_9]